MSFASKLFVAGVVATLGLGASVNAATINQYDGDGTYPWGFQYITPLDINSELGVGTEGVDYNVRYDAFENLTATPYAGPSYSAGTMWTLNASQGTESSDATAATLNKTYGTHYFASSGLYAWSGTDYSTFNVNADAIDDLSQVYFQIAVSIGGPNGDIAFPEGYSPVLSLGLGDSTTVSDLTGTLVDTSTQSVYVEAIGQNATIAYYLLSWDVSSYSSIAELNVDFGAAIHSSVYELAVYQTDYVAPVIVNPGDDDDDTPATNAVPEPATASLLALGGLAMIARRRRN